MNVLLQKHGAKHIYKVPEGLRELCADIAREVLRSQPRDIYCFIADYVETLLITRENAKVAVKIVNNILLGSQTIVSILHRAGLSLEQIARVAPRIQTAFHAYLDAVDMRAAQVYDDATCDAESRVSLQSILRSTGIPLERAEKSARIIQAAFHEHYERMLLNESQGMIQWQFAAIRTLEILRKVGASQTEASRAVILIQATYRGYYTRKNLRMKMMAARPQEKKEDEMATIEPTESVASAVAWSDVTYEEEGLERAHKAASVIQNAYKRYREKKAASVPQVESQKTMMVGAILNDLHQKVFNDIMTRADISTGFGDRENLAKAGEELRRTFKEQFTRARMPEEAEYDEEEELNEPSAEPADDGVHLNGLEEDVEENRKIEVESERDGETNVWD